ncbi:unnamed protein product [Urochloa humidicola]
MTIYHNYFLLPEEDVCIAIGLYQRRMPDGNIAEDEMSIWVPIWLTSHACSRRENNVISPSLPDQKKEPFSTSSPTRPPSISILAAKGKSSHISPRARPQPTF